MNATWRRLSFAGVSSIALAVLGGCVPDPKLSVQVTEGSSQLNGAADFGARTVYGGTVKSPSFAIENTGTSTLTVDWIAVSGTNANDFAIDNPSSAVDGPSSVSLATGDTFSFNVDFDPHTTGAESASVIVTTSLGDVTIPLKGTGVASGNMSLEYSANGTNYPVTNGGGPVDFGIASSSSPNPRITFTIKETGGAPIYLGDGFVTVTNNNGADFGVFASPNSPVAANGSGIFILQGEYMLSPGTYTETVTIPNSSSNAPNFTFTVKVQDQ